MIRDELAVAEKVDRQASLVCTRRLALLDYFRVPYEVEDGAPRGEVERLRLRDEGPALLWQGAANAPETASWIQADGGDASIPVFGSLIADDAARELLRRIGGAWTRARTLVGRDGEPIASIWHADDGSVFLPFDPDQVIHNYWSERYVEISDQTRSRGIRRALVSVYYRVRPLLPRALQIWMRRRFAKIQARTQFPKWPIETCFQDFCDLILAIVADVSGAPVPCIATWPAQYTWALVLTHDVEHAEGLETVDPIRAVERALGLRSSWNFVPKRYDVPTELVHELTADGFEAGVHGLYHDGRDLASLEILRQRLPQMREAAELWHAVGFRSPSTHRNWEWMPTLGFDYDSSSPDTDPFEPQAGGCCTWLPFMNKSMVELPITLQQDHTLFVILGHRDETAWVEKTVFLRSRGGMALINTHPDYLVDPVMFDGYARFLDHFAHDPSAWKALPREVSDWWRRRDASSLRRLGEGWEVVGPASGEARVELVSGSW